MKFIKRKLEKEANKQMMAFQPSIYDTSQESSEEGEDEDEEERFKE